MTIPRLRFAYTLPALGIAATLAWMSASAQIPNAPGTPVGTPLASPGAIDAVPPAVPAARHHNAEEADDPPGRVGRIAEVTGQAWLYDPDAGDWTAAERNRPLTSGDRLATDGGARAEVHIGSTTLRLDGGSELEVVRLDDERIALRLHDGSLATRLRSGEMAREFELTTGEGRFTVQRAGRYRFDRADEASHVTVYSGQALYEGPGSALTVNANQRAEFWLDAQNAAQYTLTDPARDAFAGWNSERDRADDRSAATRYVSPEMTGVEELDRYGRWEQNAEYGSLWIPRVVSPGWAPYSSGRWVWVRPWGWTWVDEAPWGFAPFHYGRWVNVRNTWCWAPGHYVRRPVYAPALVAWIGGPRLSVSINIGGGPAVGWVPLAPREVYVPGYRVSPRYVRNVNVTHVTNITNITTIVNNPQVAIGQQNFANRKFPHAVTVVPASVVEARRPVGDEARRWRDTPDVRRFVDDRTRVAAIAAPPLAAPLAPLRREEAGQAGRPARSEAPSPPGRVRSPFVTRPDVGAAAPAPAPFVRPAQGQGVPAAVARPALAGAIHRPEVRPDARLPGREPDRAVRRDADDRSARRGGFDRGDAPSRARPPVPQPVAPVAPWAPRPQAPDAAAQAGSARPSQFLRQASPQQQAQRAQVTPSAQPSQPAAQAPQARRERQEPPWRQRDDGAAQRTGRGEAAR